MKLLYTALFWVI